MLRNIQTNERTTKSDPLLSVKEVAVVLEVSVTSVWRYLKTGKISKPIKMGGFTRWPRSEVLAVIERAKAARDPMPQ